MDIRGVKQEDTLEMTHLDLNHASIIGQLFLYRVSKQSEGLVPFL